MAVRVQTLANMSEYIYLQGSEAVENAARSMSYSAEQMQRAAASFDNSLEAQRRYMDEWIGRFENAIESINK